MTWYSIPFKELALQDFHDIVQLRNTVFVVEQHCVFQDLDGKDASAVHLFCKDQNGSIAAYARLFAPGDYYKEASIGRIIVAPTHRKLKLGKELLLNSIEEIYRLFGNVPIKIGAQTYLQKFYESFNFFQIDAPYLEDGIPHMYMLNKSLLERER